MPDIEPTQTERDLLRASQARERLDLSTRTPADRTVRAEYLNRLIGSDQIGRSIRLSGAHISGRLLPPDCDCSRTILSFSRCRFSDPVDFSGADFLAIRLNECELPALIGASLTTKADLDLSGSRFSGISEDRFELAEVDPCSIHLEHARIGGSLLMQSTSKSPFHATSTVRINGARIDGDLKLNGARLDGAGAAALSARSITVGGDADLDPVGNQVFEASGEVAFAAANISGDLTMVSAQISNPDGRSLHCEDLNVESVILSGSRHDSTRFQSTGRINFLSAIIGGSFFMSRADLAPGPDLPGSLKKGGPIALNLQQIRVSNALVLMDIRELLADGRSGGGRPGGWFVLAGAQVTSILDDVPTGWPKPGYLDLDGAQYDRIANVAGGDSLSCRLTWLRFQFPDSTPTSDTFRPQPYEQLCQVLRGQGLTREADDVAIERIRVRLQSGMDDRWRWFFSSLLMIISEHGYSSRRAIGAFLIIVALGTALFATAVGVFDQPLVPTDGSPVAVTYSIFGHPTSTDTGCPGFDATHYALDSALPIIDLAQVSRCQFTPTGPWRWLWLLLHTLYVIGGATMSAVVILTLTGVLRRE